MDFTDKIRIYKVKTNDGDIGFYFGSNIYSFYEDDTYGDYDYLERTNKIDKNGRCTVCTYDGKIKGGKIIKEYKHKIKLNSKKAFFNGEVSGIILDLHKDIDIELEREAYSSVMRSVESFILDMAYESKNSNLRNITKKALTSIIKMGPDVSLSEAGELTDMEKALRTDAIMKIAKSMRFTGIKRLLKKHGHPMFSDIEY